MLSAVESQLFSYFGFKTTTSFNPTSREKGYAGYSDLVEVYKEGLQKTGIDLLKKIVCLFIHEVI